MSWQKSSAKRRAAFLKSKLAGHKHKKKKQHLTPCERKSADASNSPNEKKPTFVNWKHNSPHPRNNSTKKSAVKKNESRKERNSLQVNNMNWKLQKSKLSSSLPNLNMHSPSLLP